MQLSCKGVVMHKKWWLLRTAITVLLIILSNPGMARGEDQLEGEEIKETPTPEKGPKWHLSLGYQYALIHFIIPPSLQAKYPSGGLQDGHGVWVELAFEPIEHLHLGVGAEFLDKGQGNLSGGLDASISGTYHVSCVEFGLGAFVGWDSERTALSLDLETHDPPERTNHVIFGLHPEVAVRLSQRWGLVGGIELGFVPALQQKFWGFEGKFKLGASMAW